MNYNSIEELFSLFSKECEESDDSDWEPNKLLNSVNSWYCVNCTASNEEDEIFCELCNEHRQSGILQFGFMSSSDSKTENSETAHDLFTEKFSSIKSTQSILPSDAKTTVQDLQPSFNSNPVNETTLKFSTLSTAVGYDSRMLLHQEVQLIKKSPHPERPDRLRAILSGLWASGLFPGRCDFFPAREATHNELLSVHSSEHVESVESTVGKASFNFTVDTYANEFSCSSAKLAAGVSAEMTKKILNKEIKNGIALVRPPGHHSECHAVMGFCLYNNVAIAAETAKKNGAKKVLIVDWDVHHGNGTQQIFESDPSVLFISLHRYEGGLFYPGTGSAENIGKEEGKGYCVNIPWPCGGINDADYLNAFHHIIIPIAKEFSPDLIIISAGFDAARGDPLGGCDITPEGYAHMTHLLMSINEKILVILEGGYNLRSISSSMAAVTKVLLGDDPPPLSSINKKKDVNDVDASHDVNDVNDVDVSHDVNVNDNDVNVDVNDVHINGDNVNDRVCEVTSSADNANDDNDANAIFNENENLKDVGMDNRDEMPPSKAAIFAINQTFFAISPYWHSLPCQLPAMFQRCSSLQLRDFQKDYAIQDGGALFHSEQQDASCPSSSGVRASERDRKLWGKSKRETSDSKSQRIKHLTAALMLRRHRFWKSRLRQRRNANWFVFNVPFWWKFGKRRIMFNRWRQMKKLNRRSRLTVNDLEDTTNT